MQHDLISTWIALSLAAEEAAANGDESCLGDLLHSRDEVLNQLETRRSEVDAQGWNQANLAEVRLQRCLTAQSNGLGRQIVAIRKSGKAAAKYRAA